MRLLTLDELKKVVHIRDTVGWDKAAALILESCCQRIASYLRTELDYSHRIDYFQLSDVDYRALGGVVPLWLSQSFVDSEVDVPVALTYGYSFKDVVNKTGVTAVAAADFNTDYSRGIVSFIRGEVQNIFLAVEYYAGFEQDEDDYGLVATALSMERVPSWLRSAIADYVSLNLYSDGADGTAKDVDTDRDGSVVIPGTITTQLVAHSRVAPSAIRPMHTTKISL